MNPDVRAKMDALKAAVGEDGMAAIKGALRRMRDGVTIDSIVKRRLSEMTPEGRDVYDWLRRQPPGAQVEICDEESPMLLRKQETGWSVVGKSMAHRFQDLSVAQMADRWSIRVREFSPPDPNGDLIEKMGHRTFRAGIIHGLWAADGKCVPTSKHKSHMDVPRVLAGSRK